MLAVAVVLGLLASVSTYAGDLARDVVAEALAGVGDGSAGGASGAEPDPGAGADAVLEVNEGQFDPQVDFVARGDDATAYLADGGLIIDAHGGTDAQAVSLSIVGADPSVVPVVSGDTGTTTNYFIGADPAGWVTGVEAVSTVEYPGIVPGVDIRYLGTSTGLQYDLVLDPGVETDDVALVIAGADDLTVDDGGRLVVGMTVGDDLVFSAPTTYQDTTGGRQVIASSYRLGEDGTVGFDVADHDPSLPLVIDPSLALGTLIGGAGTESVVEVLIDAGGAVYLVGNTTSSAFPTTVGAYDATYNGAGDVFVTKMNAGGTAVTWSTFIGGASTDELPRDAVLGADGGIVFAASTSANDYPTTSGAYDTTFNAGVDTVVTRLASTGASLTFSSYIGGSGNDTPTTVEIDSADRIIVGGYTDASSYPITAGVVDNAYGGSSEGFLSTFATGGASLSFSTFLGDAGADALWDVDVDSTGDIHVVATTDAAAGTTPGAYDTTYNGGSDAVYGRMPSTASTIEYATYLGGASADVLNSIVATSNSTAIVSGRTASSGFPTTAGAYDTSFGGSTDVVVARIDTSQTGAAQLRYSTFIGGAGADSSDGLASDPSGRAYVTGDMASNGLATIGAPDTSHNGGADAFLAVVDLTGPGLRMLTYAGGASADDGNSVALTNTGAPIIGGSTASSAFPTTVGAYDTTFSGTSDGFVHRYSAIPVAAVAVVNSTADGADASAGNGVCQTSTASQCTLRAAIQEANASATINTIQFDIPTTDTGHSAGVWTITPASALPDITSTLTLDATTQPGWTTAPVIGLVGTSAGAGADGLSVSGDAVTVRGLSIGSFQGAGVYANGTDGTVIERSYLGVAPNGTTARANTFEGVFLDTVTNATVGGAGAGNLIGGNTSSGVSVSASTGVTIAGNTIGVRLDGATAIANADAGVYVDLGSTNVTIGGDAIGDGNTIRSNGTQGVVVLTNTTNDVAVIGNTIYANGALGIDNGGGGVSYNDVGDVDTGPNLRQNYPAITSAVASGGTITATYVLDVPAGSYRVEFFDNAAADATGYGEGQTLVGTATVTHPGGSATYTAAFPGAVGDIITATDTESLGGGNFGASSEFSAAKTAVTTTLVVNATGDASDAAAGDGVCSTGATNSAGAAACTLRAAIQESNASPAVTTINFAIPTTEAGYSAGRGVFTIAPASGLPGISDPVSIVGASQTTAIGNTNAGTLGVTQSVGTGADWVPGTGDELAVDGVARPEIEIDLPGQNGFIVSANAVTISGLAVFGGNPDVLLQSGTGVVVEDMVIGTRADSFTDPGAAARSIGSGGVWVLGGADSFVRNNLIGFQSMRGVHVIGTPSDLTVSGNEIRNNGLGSVYEGGGVEIVGYWSPGTAIHGLTVSGNLIAGHTVDLGMEIATDASDSGIVIEQNSFTGNSTAVYVYGTQNVDGGMIRGNVIAGNIGSGIGINDVANWSFMRNSLHDNGWLGIDSGAGANDSLVAPSLSSAVSESGVASVEYALTAVAGNYRVEFFDNTAADPSGAGEGETYRGASVVAHPGGTHSYTAVVTAHSLDILSASVTEDLGGTYGSTSPFSATTVVMLGDTVTVNATGDAADAAPGDEICSTGGTNSAGAAACTLRAAIQEANAHAAIDRIEFAIPSTESGYAAGVWTITPASALPAIGTTMTVDATTQPGWSATPVVAVRGSGLPAGAGLSITGAGVTISGFAIRDVPGNGITVTGAGAVIRSNHVGTDAAGTTAAANTGIGIGVSGADAQIVGNVVSGNGNDGVMLSAGADRARLVDNLIGTTLSGNAALPNGQEGVELVGVHDVVIGEVGHGNVIAGNLYAGINAWNSASTGVVVQANHIGVGRDGTTPLGNSSAVAEGGVSFRSASSGWLIGGIAAGEGNVIAHNTGDGVQLWNTSGTATGIAVVGNAIHSNTGLGIDLGDDGVTANDAGDSDTGANASLNMPVAVAVRVAGGVATYDADLDLPPGTYRLEVFANPGGADPSGYGEGRELAGAAAVVHPGGGQRRFSTTFAADAGDVLTATVTEDLGGGSFGATSEFSAAIVAAATGGTVTDHSVRRSDLTAVGGAAVPTPVTGVAAAAVDLGGGAQRLAGATTELTSGAVTLSGWTRLDTTTGAPRLISKSTGDGTAVYELLVDGTTGEAVARMTVGGSTVEVRGGSVGVGAWHQLDATWDGTTVRLYVDGAEVDTAAAAGVLGSDLTAVLTIGNTTNAAHGLDGRLDTVEVDHVARSAGWIATRHANVVQPATFVTLGVRQTAAPGAWTASTAATRSGSHALVAPAATSGTAAWATVTGVDEPGLVLESWWRVAAPGSATIASGTGTGTAPTDQRESGLTGGHVDLATVTRDTRTVEATTATTIGAGAWTHVEMRTDETGRSSVRIGGTEVVAPTLHGAGASSGSAGLRAATVGAGQWYVDDVRVRRYVSDEPTATLGALDRN